MANCARCSVANLVVKYGADHVIDIGPGAGVAGGHGAPCRADLRSAGLRGTDLRSAGLRESCLRSGSRSSRDAPLAAVTVSRGWRHARHIDRTCRSRAVLERRTAVEWPSHRNTFGAADGHIRRKYAGSTRRGHGRQLLAVVAPRSLLAGSRLFRRALRSAVAN